ncbi:S1 RNA-binding domain-containing protein, partial [Gemmatimonas sp.]|uniref:S1 RNA-binding domain-containing protein n=1 Tax=Gemmatimonas sp. TaxID=1962908 RepID=UPI0037BED307
MFRGSGISLFPSSRRGECSSAILEKSHRMSTELSPELAAEIAAAEEADLNDDAPVYGKLTAREKRDLQKSQLRPLANRRPELYEEDEFTSDEYERMLELYNGTLASIEEGEIVKAHVLEIRENLVVLDIGFKSEGTIPLEEFKDMPDLKAGDEVEVLLEHLEDQEGSVVLSKKKADFMRVW